MRSGRPAIRILLVFGLGLAVAGLAGGGLGPQHFAQAGQASAESLGDQPVARELGKLFRGAIGGKEAAAGDAQPGPQVQAQASGTAAPQPGAPAPSSAPTRAVPESREQIQLSFAPLVRTTTPGVVNIYAERMVVQRSPFAGDPFFERFFGGPVQGQSRRQLSLGSGVIIDKSGLIVTNNHVVKDADEIKVALADGREYTSKVILKDERVDLAVLRIKADEALTTIPFADSDAVEVGDLVLAIGNPFGVGQTVTSGIVSALARSQAGVSDFSFFIQTDAAINPGNSGGALIDMNGRLIGINTAIYSRTGASNGIGFAIPANLVKAFVLAAEAGADHFDTPYIGAAFEPVTGEFAEALGLPAARGALVSSVVKGGPADKAGLKAGDVVVAMNGQPVDHPDALGYRLATTGIGQTAELSVVARGETRTVSIRLDRAPETVPAKKHVLKGNNPFAGAEIANLSPRIADELRMQGDAKGVVVTAVADGSPAARFGLQPGDIVVAVNDAEIRTVDDLDRVVAKPQPYWRFDINRDGQLLRQLVR